MASTGLRLHRGIIAFVDVVESVRLIAEDGGAFIARWLHQRSGVEAILQQHNGRLVRSTGDGLIGEFADARAALKAAFETQARLASANAGAERPVVVRIGLSKGTYYADDKDIYGEAVNLAARLTGLGQPDSVIASDAVAADLTDGIDAVIEDLGACFLKHIDKPVRAYALRPVGSIARAPALARHPVSLVPTIAILPLVRLHGEGASDALGDIIADTLIADLSGSPYLNVISRMSATMVSASRLDPTKAAQALGADYIVSGSYALSFGRMRTTLELMERKSGLVLIEERFSLPADALVAPDFRGFESFTARLLHAVLRSEVQRLKRQTLPNLESHSLLLGAVGMMHRPQEDDFFFAANVLQTLMDRHPREGLPAAWLACWYTIKVQKGFSTDPEKDGLQARELARRALDLEADTPLALAVAGLIETNFGRDFEAASQLLECAANLNPNDTFALLHKAALLTFTDRGEESYQISRKARLLSPVDPHRYYFEAIAASAAFSAGKYPEAITHADEAIRANRLYPSPSRVRTSALFHLGQHDEARAAAKALLRVDPELTVHRWLRQSPAADYDVGRRLAEGLKGAGIPDS
ncbi:MAG TPA: adenylate/guanylate cyclase domain-containing protein [Beijerinckiaceae bacterium]|nr:adenylate/guanylate cyclase domain-containing protein [Beijerinckiaceae bacterium]